MQLPLAAMVNTNLILLANWVAEERSRFTAHVTAALKSPRLRNTHSFFALLEQLLGLTASKKQQVSRMRGGELATGVGTNAVWPSAVARSAQRSRQLQQLALLPQRMAGGQLRRIA